MGVVVLAALRRQLDLALLTVNLRPPKVADLSTPLARQHQQLNNAAVFIGTGLAGLKKGRISQGFCNSLHTCAFVSVFARR